MTAPLEAGTSLADLRAYFGAAVTTNVNGVDTAVCVEGITFDANTQYAYTRKWSPTAFGFFKVRYNSNSSTFRNGVALLELLDNSEVPVLRLFSTSTTTAVLQYYNGSWNTVGTGVWTLALDFTTAAIKSLVIEWECTADGALGLYLNGVQVERVTGDFSALSSIASAKMYRMTSSNSDYFSEWIATLENNISYRYYLKPPNAAGALTAWSGAFGDIDETGISTVDYISSSAADQKITFKAAARTFASPVEVKAVVVSFYARKGSTGPTKIAPMLRISATDYETTEQSMGFGYQSFRAIIETNPATGIAWTRSEANDVNVEFGFKSAA